MFNTLLTQGMDNLIDDDSDEASDGLSHEEERILCFGDVVGLREEDNEWSNAVRIDSDAEEYYAVDEEVNLSYSFFSDAHKYLLYLN